jgi:hypothetical protein
MARTIIKLIMISNSSLFKRYILILISLLSLFSLVGCSNSELEAKKLEVNRENAVVSNVVKEYNSNISNVTTLNNEVKKYITDYSPTNTDVTFDFEVYSKTDRVFSDTLKSIMENMYNDEDLNKRNAEVIVETYPFMEEKTGEIQNLIIVNREYKTNRIYMSWKNGKFVNYYFE